MSSGVTMKPQLDAPGAGLPAYEFGLASNDVSYGL